MSRWGACDFAVGDLVNTLSLAALALTAWWGQGGQPLQLRRQGAVGWTLLSAFACMLVLGMNSRDHRCWATRSCLRAAFRPLRTRWWRRWSNCASCTRSLRLSSVCWLGWRPGWNAGAGQAVCHATIWPSDHRAMHAVAARLAQRGAQGPGLAAILVHLAVTSTIWIVLVLLAAAALACKDAGPKISEAHPSVAMQGSARSLERIRNLTLSLRFTNGRQQSVWILSASRQNRRSDNLGIGSGRPTIKSGNLIG